MAEKLTGEILEQYRNERVEVHSYPWMLFGTLRKDKRGYFVDVRGGLEGYAEVRLNGLHGVHGKGEYDIVEGTLRVFL